MNEVHIKQPIYYGDRTNMMVGVARFRLLKSDGTPKRGNIRIWIDMKVQDNLDPTRTKLAYEYPFVISCSKALEYPIQVLNDYNRTRLHIIPIKDLKLQKTRRKRTMAQDEFKKNIVEVNNGK